jgi:hypothetical protein
MWRQMVSRETPYSALIVSRRAPAIRVCRQALHENGVRDLLANQPPWPLPRLGGVCAHPGWHRSGRLSAVDPFFWLDRYLGGLRLRMPRCLFHRADCALLVADMTVQVKPAQRILPNLSARRRFCKRAAWRQIFRNRPPLASRAQHIHDPVHHFARMPCAISCATMSSSIWQMMRCS